jgi:hypothetical protein
MSPKLILAAILTCSLAAGPGHAGSSSYAFSYTLAGGDPNLDLPQFDPSLGTLLSMQVDVSAYSLKAVDVLTFDEPVTVIGMLQGAWARFLTVGGVVVIADMPTATSMSDFGPFEVSSASVFATGHASHTYTSGLDPFLGDGTVAGELGVEPGFVSWIQTGPADIEQCHRCGDFGVSAVVTYYYNVPEPASWTLMLVGFGMVGGAWRHRRGHIAVSWEASRTGCARREEVLISVA